MRTLALTLVLLSAAPLAAADDAARRRAIESGLATTVAIEGVQGPPLVERMRELGVPALSYAVVEDGKIVLAAAIGEADVAAQRPATTATLFQAASLSKPVTAMAVMELVERGRIRLDEPVSSYLRTWQLPENDLTRATPVTLRLLLSHSAGTTVHGFPGYAAGEPRPTLAQVLRGEAPANTAPVVVDLAPNTKFRYSGGGTTVAQAALIDELRMPFPELMRRTVLEPLGMRASTYQQPLPPSRRAQAATAYLVGTREVGGKWHVYPEMAAAGLWTTPTDLAKVIVEIQNALAGRETKLLSIDAARHMLTPRLPLGPNHSAGIGFILQQQGDTRYFTHGGANEGFRSTIIASAGDSAAGKDGGWHGAVVMANSDAAGGLVNEVANTIAREYGWPGFTSTPLRSVPAGDALTRFPGRYRRESGEIVTIRANGERLELLDLTLGWVPLYPLADGTLTRADRDTRFARKAEGLELIGAASSARPQRIIAAPIADGEPAGGDELLAAGRIDEALAAYREQFRTHPEQLPEASFNRAGAIFLAANRIPEAVAILRLATELYPASANAYGRLAGALLAAGDEGGATAALEELLRRVDADPGAAPAAKESLRRSAERQLERLRR